MTTSSTTIAQIYKFLAEIGIPVVEAPITQDTFLPGILIDKGALIVDPAKLIYPGDLVHEAGHIAVSLPADRLLLHDNVTEGRPDKQGDEIAVILWTYAACLHIGLPADVVFHAGGYKGASQWLMDTFASKNYVGLPLLVWMGMTNNPAGGEGFPVMKNWLRQEPEIDQQAA